ELVEAQVPDVPSAGELTTPGQDLAGSKRLGADDREELHQDELRVLAQAHSAASDAHQATHPGAAQRSQGPPARRDDEPLPCGLARQHLRLMVPPVCACRLARATAAHHANEERGVVAPARTRDVDL